jgi:hypothetical protein
VRNASRAFRAQESLLFEIELAKVSQARELRRNATRMYNPMTLAQLQDLAPIVPWVTYINNILTQKIIQVGSIGQLLAELSGQSDTEVGRWVKMSCSSQ